MEITIQDKIKSQRILYGYTQKQLAKKLNWSIVKYSHFEMGHTKPTFLRYYELQKISELLNIPISDLILSENK